MNATAPNLLVRRKPGMLQKLLSRETLLRIDYQELLQQVLDWKKDRKDVSQEKSHVGKARDTTIRRNIFPESPRKRKMAYCRAE